MKTFENKPLTSPAPALRRADSVKSEVKSLLHPFQKELSMKISNLAGELAEKGLIEIKEGRSSVATQTSATDVAGDKRASTMSLSSKAREGVLKAKGKFIKSIKKKKVLDPVSGRIIQISQAQDGDPADDNTSTSSSNDEEVAYSWAGKLEMSLKTKSSKKGLVRLKQDCLPASFAMHITSWKMKSEALKRYGKKSKKNLEKFIGEIVQEYGRSLQEERANGKRIVGGLAGFIYEYYLNKFGLPAIADANMVLLAASIHKYRGQSARINYFAKFAFGELSDRACDIWIDSMVALATQHAEEITRGMPAIAAATEKMKMMKRLPDAQEWNVDVSACLGVIEQVLRAIHPSAFDEVVTGITSLAAVSSSLSSLPSPIPKGGGVRATFMKAVHEAAERRASTLHVNDPTGTLRAEMVVDLAVKAFICDVEEKRKFVKDAFLAGDVDGDGELTAAEFAAIVQFLVSFVPLFAFLQGIAVHFCRYALLSFSSADALGYVFLYSSFSSFSFFRSHCAT